MGSVETIIRENRDGTSSVRYRGVPWDAIAGKRGPTRSFERETDAHVYMRAWERDNANAAEEAGLPTRRKRVLVSEYAADYAQTMPGESTTRRDRQSTARRVAEEFKGVYLDELNRHRIQKWDIALEKQLAPGTRRNRMGFLSKMCDSAIVDGYMVENPTKGIPRAPHVTKKQKAEFAIEEIERIMSWLPPQLRIVVHLAFSSGMRAGEICGLTWKHVDLDKRVVHIRDVQVPDGSIRGYTKGKTHRTVPLSGRTVAALKWHRRYVTTGPDDFVACNLKFGKLTTKWLASMWSRKMSQYQREMLAATGKLRPVPRFHDLRHYSAHDLVRRGVQVRVLQVFLGHKNLNTTQIYMPDVTVDAMAAAMAAPVRQLAAV